MLPTSSLSLFFEKDLTVPLKNIISEMEFKEFESRFKSAKTRF